MKKRGPSEPPLSDCGPAMKRRASDQRTYLPPVDLPDWLPPPVCNYVSSRWGVWKDDENALAILRRIAATPKMEDVWTTLKKRRASDDKLRDFVSCACEKALLYGRKIVPATTRRENDALAKRLSDAADLCRQIIPPSGRSRIRPKLVEAASVMANFFEVGARLQRSLRPPWVVENHIKNDEIRAYVQFLGAETKDLFGNVLFGTVATVASITLDRKISQRQVRNWYKESNKSASASFGRRK